MSVASSQHNRWLLLIHLLADVQARNLGPNTCVWRFLNCLPGAQIRTDCNICSHVLIENDVVIGDSVMVKFGVQFWDSLRIESDIFIGTNATFTNDPFSHSKQCVTVLPVTTVKIGASIGGGCNHLVKSHHWPANYGGRRRRGNSFCAERGVGDWQLSAYFSIYRGAR